MHALHLAVQMKTQPQPPERRPLHRADDPASVVRDAELPYGFNHDAALSTATRQFLVTLYESDILQLSIHHPTEPETLLAQLAPHMPASDINALRQILIETQQRLNHRNRF